MQKLFRILLLLNVVAIEYLATSSSHFKAIDTIWDKAKHSFAFFVLYILLTLAFRNIGAWKKVLILLIYGIQIEFIQHFIPNREASLFDIIANFIGIILGFLTTILYYKIVLKQSLK